MTGQDSAVIVADLKQALAPIKVIYHGAECPDGFGSAWAAWAFFSSLPEVKTGQRTIEYIAANHGEAVPDCYGAEVYLVDFSYRRAVLKQILKAAKKVTILDHHITACDDLDGLDDEHDNLTMVFDMQRSGAVITWDFFHHTPPPLLLQYVQDRDLWHFALPDSRDVTAAIMSYPFDFSRWQLWHEEAEKRQELNALAQEGKTINRYRQQLIDYYCKRAVPGNIAGHIVPVVNSPLAINSELLNVLAQDQAFAAGYSDKGMMRYWSLRSTKEGADVAAIAFAFGGGGHPRAAGFSMPLDETMQNFGLPKSEPGKCSDK